ncbi:DUF397 domain-containing protein [Nocardiopsis gilva YIM 90087]|uniref:DUF397 domain-containing protein n=1 Tax=Nocardiopsis gilva YIM 90087 TaxID=1235441 RepID=A0A223S9F3_9ACTN|nr:DUF397 domain-containing protein [Nocardiopsis gilva]ASU84719.1 DUF397 domain-containing protein [Nocardiopsis gilva YIM 90087]
MQQAYNGIPAADLNGAEWLKSSLSNPDGNCVELSRLPGGEFALRNSRHPHGPALIYTPAELAAFVKGAKQGDFDHLIEAATID